MLYLHRVDLMISEDVKMEDFLKGYKEMSGSRLSQNNNEVVTYEDRELHNLLMLIDRGYLPTNNENQMLQSVKSMDWSYSDITKLPNSLRYMTSLTELSLEYTEVSDISALSNLPFLSSLNLNGTEISDISALSNLISLSDLSLSRTKVSDISALSNLTSLSNLDLSSTEVSDISALLKCY